MDRTSAAIEIIEDGERLARRVAAWLLEATENGGRFAVALAGGATPRRLYEVLAEPPFRNAFPWSRSHWFWGDERFVPPDHPDSNQRMVREAMLSRVPAPAGNIHPIGTTGSPAAAARSYEAELQAFYGRPSLDAIRPLFDVVLLGIGADGHTASLFPETPALDERERWVTAVASATPRITLTFPALDSARRVAFLVAGSGKSAVLERLRRGDDLPAARLRPIGTLHWFIDRAAAGGEDNQGQHAGF